MVNNKCICEYDPGNVFISFKSLKSLLSNGVWVISLHQTSPELLNFKDTHIFHRIPGNAKWVKRPIYWLICFCPPLSQKRRDIKSHSSDCPSVCPSQNFILCQNCCNITSRALILGMYVLCDKTFPMVPCRDLDGDLWPTSNLLSSGVPQFSEFACCIL